LSTSRDGNGWGPNPIRVGEARNYAELLGMGHDEALKLLRLVQEMDTKYLDFIAEKGKKDK
jgi:hypothetical protein